MLAIALAMMVTDGGCNLSSGLPLSALCRPFPAGKVNAAYRYCLGYSFTLCPDGAAAGMALAGVGAEMQNHFK